MKTLFCAIIFSSISTFTTAQSTDQVSDSIKFYQKQMIKLNKAYRDSLLKSAEYKDLSKKIMNLNRKSDDYTAFVLSSSINTIDFEKFNSDISKTGFNKFSGNMYSIGIGFSVKNKRKIFDFQFLSLGIRKKTKKAEESITINSSSMLNATWGYDFVKSGKINIYPYLGIGFAGLNLQYKSPVVTNDSAQNISTIILNNRSVDTDIFPICFQAGVGVEYVLTNNSNAGGIILFSKAGTVQPFKRNPFEVEGRDYNPQFNFGALSFSVGFKFFGR
jgi:opacity protein-like surface antigen